ncbi:MAG: SUMF1/EgtB/PvdO family nonheme iron enzyme [Polyangiaceae bacterium]
MHRAFLVIALAAGPFAACAFGGFGCGGQLLGDDEGTDQNGTIDSDSGASHGDSAANNVVAKGKCPSGLPGPALIPLEENGAIPYCIDATEVTNAHYAQFLASNPTANSSDGACAQSSSFAPEFNWPAAAADANRPVVNVDWCDAKAFCAWAGKKLCGAPGGVSGKVVPIPSSDTSLWYAACSNLGADLFPYGNTYVGTMCNGADDQKAETDDVDHPPTCTNENSSQIFDMSGNVWEWEDACEDDTPTGSCILRGGSFRSGEDSLSCGATDLTARNSKFDDFGFRCCAE